MKVKKINKFENFIICQSYLSYRFSVKKNIKTEIYCSNL